MKSTYDVSATAKINMYLKVCGSIPNGYHQLDTLMQEVSLSDRLVITIDDEREYSIVTVCENSPRPIPNNKNLCYKAAVRFFSVLKRKKKIVKLPFVKIELTKNIPSEAGLGGGSSDAASVILALQDFYNEPFSQAELNKIAADTGADTPFFLYGGSCVCEGIGDVVSPVSSIADLPLILIKPAKGVSTPKCFAGFDASGSNHYDKKAYAALKADLASDEIPAGESFRAHRELFVNDLEEFAAKEVPDIKIAEDLLEREGAEFAMMSGSGSCVFGVFESVEKRDLAFDKISSDSIISDKKMKVYSCETV